MTEASANELALALGDLPLASRLKRIRQTFEGKLVFTTSLGLEDQVLTHLIFAEGLDIEVATLDTGRLFPETYALWADTEMHYGRRIRGYAPDRIAIERLLDDQGINGFRLSPDARKACCHVRKVEPLQRVLAGAEGWLTGLRASQSAFRQGTGALRFDPEFGLWKINPLFDQTREELAELAGRWSIPVNPLHEAGFLSIGCQPCTRAIQPGEDERAGRWWWEADASRECGLHLARAEPASEGRRA
ncbi:MAG: phosphoadenylyl-sulfate reductase [Beijerinckiaceae bacterium]|nr:phosphoadenylyl-sulfate reductase [Beijerinckiaceae bacterium]MCZ8299035.1 phosphoadenylyl-sulfate reductase [Beijerinckiaceae bacterium]